jgi:hypothetical protein
LTVNYIVVALLIVVVDKVFYNSITLALGLTRLMGALLFSVQATDPVTFGKRDCLFFCDRSCGGRLVAGISRGACRSDVCTAQRMTPEAAKTRDRHLLGGVIVKTAPGLTSYTIKSAPGQSYQGGSRLFIGADRRVEIYSQFPPIG